MARQNRTSNFSFLFLALVMLLCFSWLWRMDNSTPKLDYSQVRQQFEQENVESFDFTDEHTLVLNLRREVEGSKTVRYQMYDVDLFFQDMNDLILEQKAKGIITSYDYPPPADTNWLEILLPWVLMALLVGVMWYFFFVRAQGGMGGDRMAKFGAARTRTLSDKDRKVTFDDVAGADEEKEELQEVVEFLRDPKKFMTLGARIPKGVLLVGPPGTGKTLLAKAVAGEAGVGFLSISGSDFVELYVGVGASRVRDLFDQAKKSSRRDRRRGPPAGHGPGRRTRRAGADAEPAPGGDGRLRRQRGRRRAGGHQPRRRAGPRPAASRTV